MRGDLIGSTGRCLPSLRLSAGGREGCGGQPPSPVLFRRGCVLCGHALMLACTAQSVCDGFIQRTRGMCVCVCVCLCVCVCGCGKRGWGEEDGILLSLTIYLHKLGIFVLFVTSIWMGLRSISDTLYSFKKAH